MNYEQGGSPLKKDGKRSAFFDTQIPLSLIAKGRRLQGFYAEGKSLTGLGFSMKARVKSCLGDCDK
jgi:hypothetical protein